MTCDGEVIFNNNFTSSPHPLIVFGRDVFVLVKAKNVFLSLHFTLFSPSSAIQRVGEDHPSACLTNYSKGVVMVDCISSSPLSKAVLKQLYSHDGTIQ